MNTALACIEPLIQSLNMQYNNNGIQLINRLLYFIPFITLFSSAELPKHHKEFHQYVKSQTCCLLISRSIYCNCNLQVTFLNMLSVTVTPAVTVTPEVCVHLLDSASHSEFLHTLEQKGKLCVRFGHSVSLIVKKR